MSLPLPEVPGDAAQLVRAAAAGDGRAKRTLVENTLPFVHRMMTRLVGRRAEHDDLVQTVYARCFRSLGTFRGEASFTTWLGAICVNVATNYWRERKANEQNVGDAPELLLISGGNTENQLAAREGLREAQRLLSSMSASLRTAFVLHVLEGYDIDTVAAMTHTSAAAAYKAVERARKHIEARRT